MPVKQVLILANSRKPPGRCVAGREVIETDDGWELGDWVRPVSNSGDGGLSLRQCCLNNGNQPAVFDVVNIPLTASSPTASQPENWSIDESKSWKKVRGIELPELAVDTPRDLWLHPASSQDRISPAQLASISRNASLYVVEVGNFRIELSNNWYNGSPRRRALFRYRGREYDFGLTDIGIHSKYCSPHPAVRRIVRLEGGDTCKICVSLTPEFDGNHYKVVATVFEPEDDE